MKKKLKSSIQIKQGIRQTRTQSLRAVLGFALLAGAALVAWHSFGGDGGGPQLVADSKDPPSHTQGEGGDNGGPRKNPTRPS
jgi:hypothetical protein